MYNGQSLALLPGSCKMLALGGVEFGGECLDAIRECAIA
jgi:hypothetical protein